MEDHSIKQIFNGVEEEYLQALQRIRSFTTDDIEVSSVTNDGIPIRKLFISNLSARTTHKDLISVFSKYGVVTNCYVTKAGTHSKFSFVTFATVEGALGAHKAGVLKLINVHNRDLRIMPADSWHQPDSFDNQYYRDLGKEVLETSIISPKRLPPIEELVQDPSKPSIHVLNNDCLIHIFEYLPVTDKIRMERVCKRWRLLSQDSWASTKTLDLTYQTWGFTGRRRQQITTDRIRKVLLRCGKYLHTLDLSLAPYDLTRSTLSQVGKFCSNLRTIDVTGIMLSSASISSIISCCSELENISIGMTSYTCDSDLKNLFAKTKKLKYLKFDKNLIVGKCLLNLPCDTLEELVINSCFNLRSHFVSEALTRLHNLKQLTIQCCLTLNTSVMQTIGKMKQLRYLKLSGRFPSVTSVDILTIADIENLLVFVASNCDLITDTFMRALIFKCRNLIEIDVSNCHELKDDGLMYAHSLKQLHTLKLNSNPELNDDSIQNVINIKHFECQNTRISDEGARNLIRNSPDLQFLDFSKCSRITNRTLEEALLLTNNRASDAILKIYVGRTSVDLSGYIAITPYLQIINVDLHRMELETDSVPDIAVLRDLRRR